jgi:hypothetical protein
MSGAITHFMKKIQKSLYGTVCFTVPYKEETKFGLIPNCGHRRRRQRPLLPPSKVWGGKQRFGLISKSGNGRRRRPLLPPCPDFGGEGTKFGFHSKLRAQEEAAVPPCCLTPRIWGEL